MAGFWDVAIPVFKAGALKSHNLIPQLRLAPAKTLEPVLSLERGLKDFKPVTLWLITELGLIQVR